MNILKAFYLIGTAGNPGNCGYGPFATQYCEATVDASFGVGSSCYSIRTLLGTCTFPGTCPAWVTATGGSKCLSSECGGSGGGFAACH